MTSHVVRLYVVAAGVLTFFLSWAAVAAHPWAPKPAVAAADPRVAALTARQQRVHFESLRVQKVVRARWAAYRAALAKHNAGAAQLASAPATPSVRVVTLPPLTVTRMS
jgi:hypothetical protein